MPLDVTDLVLPSRAVLTSPSVHDSQVAILLMRLTASKVVSCYDLMDAAYAATQIVHHSLFFVKSALRPMARKLCPPQVKTVANGSKVRSFCYDHFMDFRLGGIEEMVKATKNAPQIEIRKAGSKEFYFVFKLPSNGMFISIFFENISEVTAATENIQRHSKINEYYLLETTPPEQTHFIFRPKNKYPIGQSTMYEHESAMKHGLQYMIKHLLSAEIVNLTT